MAEYKLHGWAVLVALLFAFLIEYYMIVVESFVNFRVAFGNDGGFFIYALVTIFSLLFLKLAFRRIKTKRFLGTYALALIIVVIIGLFWSYFQGYVNSQLFDPYWEFTHDFVYTGLVSQFVVLSILLIGTKELEYELEDESRWAGDDEDYDDEVGEWRKSDDEEISDEDIAGW